MFKPSTSSRGGTRKRIKWRKIYNAINAIENAYAPTLRMPKTCTESCWGRVKPVPNIDISANNATATVPHIPANKCTGTTDKTSSILNFINNLLPTNMTMPPITPINAAASGVTAWAEAVMATNPAIMPLSVEMMSVYRLTRLKYKLVVIPPNAAAIAVLRIIRGTSSDSIKVLPPLKPNQPNQIKKVPSTDKVRLLPLGGGRLRLNRPRRGPIIITAANATHPPTECTMVEPAKSTKPILSSQP